MNDKKPNEIPARFMELIEPLLIEGEVIETALRESFKFETFFRKWIVLTNFRLLICTRKVWGVDSKEYHLREMDVERVRDNIGPYDSLIFKSQDKILYRVEIFRTRRKEAEEFLREVTKHIAERDLYIAFPNTGDNDVETFPKAVSNTVNNNPEALTPEDLARCAEELEHDKDLKELGVITEKEYMEEVAKPCKKKTKKVMKPPYVRQKS